MSVFIESPGYSWSLSCSLVVGFLSTDKKPLAPEGFADMWKRSLGWIIFCDSTKCYI